MLTLPITAPQTIFADPEKVPKLVQEASEQKKPVDGVRCQTAR
jgi:hypothetical protein